MIRVTDNVFDEKEIDVFYAEFRDNMGWTFTGEGLKDSNWRKFHMFLNKDHPVHLKLFNKSDQLLKETLPSVSKSHVLKNYYASGYLYGTHHQIHTDYDKGGFTVMFYLNKLWDVSYAGETIFLNNIGDITNSVIPKPGRVVIFDGTIPHAAREVSRICVELRMVATFKYEHK